MSFAANLQSGKLGESMIARWLISRGHHILPAYEIEVGKYKGPQLYTAKMNLVVPDLFCFGKKFLWVEAKNKSAFTFTRKIYPYAAGRWVTGIDLNHYEQYLTVQELTRCPVWIFFLQNRGRAKDSEPSPYIGLYGASLNTLLNHEHHRHENHGRHGMVYWSPTEEGGPLKKLAELSAITGSGFVVSSNAEPWHRG